MVGVINIKEVLTAVGGTEAVMLRLLQKFRERAPATLTGLRRAAEAADWATLKRDAHSLKGSSGYVAASPLREAAIALEGTADQSTSGAASQQDVLAALLRVEEEMARVVAAIGAATGEATP